MTAKKYIIAADIELMAPMHITAIESGTYDPKTRRLYRYDGLGIGCSLTRTVAIASAARVLDAGGVTVPVVPVIPASTVAGKLRRNAADLLFTSLVKRGLRISPDAYNTMTSGMATTELKVDQATPETMRAARRDPFLSLFGGTSFAMSAGSVIAEGWPLLEVTKNLLMTEPIAALLPFTDIKEMTDAVAIVRKNDVASMTGQHLEGVVGVEKLADYVEGETNARNASKAKKSAGEEGKKTDLRTLNAVEAVRSGMGFALRVEVTARTPAHLGLMLLAFQGFLRSAQVGGKGARGMGAFTCNASRLYELDPANREKVVLSSLFEGKTTGYEFVHNGVVDEAVIAAEDYIDGANPLLFEAFAAADAKAIKSLQAEVA